jgi:hypothetical protein
VGYFDPHLHGPYDDRVEIACKLHWRLVDGDFGSNFTHEGDKLSFDYQGRRVTLVVIEVK